jgi:tRNA(Ile)-lysidine synthase
VTDLESRIQARITTGKKPGRGAHVVIAVSGGVDSMALLHVLKLLAPRLGWTLSVAHFNHQLRGLASDADERLVRATARRLRLACDISRGDVHRLAKRTGVSLEMAARQLRHAFLARCAKRRRAGVIALAQHSDDQVELFLLRLLRGAGGSGLSGMKRWGPSPAEKRLVLFRPLLEVSKAELLELSRIHQIPFREDASNASTEFDRNWVRLELLPFLCGRYAGAARTLRRSMLLVQADAEVVGIMARDWLAGRGGAGFAELPVAVQRRVVHEQLIVLGVEPDFEWVEWLRSNTGQPLTIAPGATVVLQATGRVEWHELVRIKFSGKTRLLRVPVGTGRAQGEAVFAGVTLKWRIFRRTKSSLPAHQAGVERFDAERIGPEIRLGHWQAGDRFQPIGMRSTTKLQDWFTNRKVPADRRRELILARSEQGTIFWVEGERIGEAAKISPDTRWVLEWRWKRS